MGGFVIGAFIYLGYSSIHDKTELASLKRVHAESVAALGELKGLYDRIDLLEGSLSRIRELETKVRSLARLEESEERGPLSGLGGPVPEAGVQIEGGARETIASFGEWADRIEDELDRREKNLEKLKEQLEERSLLLAVTPRRWPTHGWVTSGYGYRPSPFTGDLQMHEGIDIAGRMGTAVTVPSAGVVLFAGFQGSMGRTVVIDHGYGYVTRYGHLDQISVKVGDRLKRGQKIGTLGNSGRSTGPHLHYEVRLGGVPIDPAPFLN